VVVVVLKTTVESVGWTSWKQRGLLLVAAVMAFRWRRETEVEEEEQSLMLLLLLSSSGKAPKKKLLAVVRRRKKMMLMRTVECPEARDDHRFH
jgi:hypothetical protein